MRNLDMRVQLSFDCVTLYQLYLANKAYDNIKSIVNDTLEEAKTKSYMLSIIYFHSNNKHTHPKNTKQHIHRKYAIILKKNKANVYK